MKTILGVLIASFAGFILGWGDIAYFYQWEFYAIIVPFVIVLIIYGNMK